MRGVYVASTICRSRKEGNLISMSIISGRRDEQKSAGGTGLTESEPSQAGGFLMIPVEELEVGSVVWRLNRYDAEKQQLYFMISRDFRVTAPVKGPYSVVGIGQDSGFVAVLIELIDDEPRSAPELHKLEELFWTREEAEAHSRNLGAPTGAQIEEIEKGVAKMRKQLADRGIKL